MAITANVSRKSALTKVGPPAELSVLLSRLQNPGVSTPQPDHRLFCKAVKGLMPVATVMLYMLIQQPLFLSEVVRAFRQPAVQVDGEMQFDAT